MRFGTAVIDSTLPCWDRYGDRRYPFGIWKDLLSEEDLEGNRGRNGKELDPDKIKCQIEFGVYHRTRLEEKFPFLGCAVDIDIIPETLFPWWMTFQKLHVFLSLAR